MALKKGQDFYDLCVFDDGQCAIDIWRVTTINKNGVYLIKVAPHTWINRAAKGRAFSKTKDYGWADAIDARDKKHFRPSFEWELVQYAAEEALKKSDLRSTILAAWKVPQDLKFWELTEEECKAEGYKTNPADRARKAIAAMIKKLEAAKKAKKK